MEIKTDIPGIYRGDSGALINKDNSGLSLYKNKKEQFRRMTMMEKKIELLFNEMSEIKNILKNLITEDKINANSTDNNK
ncbi:MAG: hypothetical protein ACOYNN_10350 [Terrimicrobiaceae bacterium]